ncbi:MAG: hypothetical protein AAB093_07680 [Nitrospirota bacterium]
MKTLRTSLKRYFLTGLLVITPIWGTVLILKTLFVIQTVAPFRGPRGLSFSGGVGLFGDFLGVLRVDRVDF